MLKTVTHHCKRMVGAVQDAASAITNPGRYAEKEGDNAVAYRPNYMLAGHMSPHVYGYPHQGKDVRIAAVSDSDVRRKERNFSLHYSEKDYKPMFMAKRFRRL